MISSIFFTWRAINWQDPSTIIFKWGLVTEEVISKRVCDGVKLKWYQNIWKQGRFIEIQVHENKKYGLLFKLDVDVHRSNRKSQFRLGHQVLLVSSCRILGTFGPKLVLLKYIQKGLQIRSRSRRNPDVRRKVVGGNSFLLVFLWLRYDSMWCIFFTWRPINRLDLSTIFLKWGLVTAEVYSENSL